jgi:peptidoglycan/LPS O-acetylase OafA/YrhL
MSTAYTKAHVESTRHAPKLPAGVDIVDSQTGVAASVWHFLYERVWRRFRDTVSDAYNNQYYPLGYSRGLDGLRGLMTIGTMTSHIYHPAIPGSVLFMDIFYVLSGYFITGLLIRDTRQHGTVRFGSFYRRRFSRLLPPLFTMIALFLIFGYFLAPPFADLVREALGTLFYFTNWWRAFRWPGTFYLGHTWSLAVEEQFYLLWPITFLLFFRLWGVGWRMLAGIFSIAAVVWIWRCWLTWNGAPFQRLYNGFDTRADALMMGCALAVVLALVSLENRPGFDRLLKLLTWPVTVIFLMFTFFFIDNTDRYYYYVGIPLLGAGLGVALIVILIRPLDTVLHRVLGRRELVFLGRIFYAMYLFHFPMFMMMQKYGFPIWQRVVFGYPITVLLALLSYAFIESHFMRTKKSTEPARPVIGMKIIEQPQPGV